MPSRPASSERTIRQALRYGGGWLPLLSAVALVGAAAELLLPAALGYAVDAALGTARPQWIAVVGALLVVLIASDTLGEVATGFATARATGRLRHRFLRHVLDLDPRTAARHPVGDLVTRLISQATDAGKVGTTVVLGGAALLPAAGSLVALTLLDPLLGATFLAGLLLLAVLMRTFVTDASAAVSGYQRVQGLIAGRLVEALAGARTIAAAGTVTTEIKRVLAPLGRLAAYGRRTWSTLARAATGNAALAPLLQLAILGVAGWSVAAGRLTTGQLFAALRYAALGAGLGAVVTMLSEVVRARAGARRLDDVLREPPQPHGPVVSASGRGELTLRNVTVRDDQGDVILRDITLRIPAGCMVAVVGGSGSGKSTLAAVAGRLRDPDSGEVLLDGIPLRLLSREALRRAIGYGFERPVLVGETVGEAIALGPERWPAGGEVPPAVRRAAQLAAIDGYVERLPKGYHTPLADAPMSGGEAQRLGLARALRAERLLILDDATSSVDVATERRIARSLAVDLAGRTRLVVTHRAATADAADFVAWLDGGRLRAVGRHRDLWTDPAYRAVFTAGVEAAR
ncbi:MAG TPA: ABC transporter ATP-binding protein [Micromonospora sp.]